MRFWIKALHFASADDTTYKASSRPPRNSSSPSEKKTVETLHHLSSQALMECTYVRLLSQQMTSHMLRQKFGFDRALRKRRTKQVTILISHEQLKANWPVSIRWLFEWGTSRDNLDHRRNETSCLPNCHQRPNRRSSADGGFTQCNQSAKRQKRNEENGSVKLAHDICACVADLIYYLSAIWNTCSCLGRPTEPLICVAILCLLACRMHTVVSSDGTRFNQKRPSRLITLFLLQPPQDPTSIARWRK